MHEGSSSPSARLIPLWCLLPVGLALLLYWPSLSYPFLQWDDPIYVTSRAALHQLAHGQSAGWQHLLSPTESWAGRFWEYFPVRDLSYGIDAWRSGLTPAAFHQTNLLLHLFSICLVLLLGRLLGLVWWASSLAACCFALHPIQVEPVAWISSRKDLLYSSATMAALCVWLGQIAPLSRKKNHSAPLWAWGLFGLLCLLSFGSKGPGIVVVPLACWWVLGQEQQRRWPLWTRLMPLAAIAAVWLWVTIQIGLRNRVMQASGDGTIGGLWRAFGAPLRAFARFLFPVTLSPSHGKWPTVWWADPHSAGMLLLLLLGVLVWARHKAIEAPEEATETSEEATETSSGFDWQAPFPLALLLIGSVCVSILPNSGIVAVNQPQADRFLYLTLAWCSLLVAWFLMKLKRPLGVGLVVLFVLVCAWRAHHYVRAWRSDVTLWRYVYEQTPDHPIAAVQLSLAAMQKRKMKLAFVLLQRAKKKHPTTPTIWSTLGSWWHTRALHTKGAASLRAAKAARRAYQKAIALGVKAPEVYNGLALLAQSQKEWVEAERLFAKALSLPQAPPVIYLNQARCLWRQGKQKAARAAILRGLHKYPTYRPLRKWLKEKAPPTGR